MDWCMYEPPAPPVKPGYHNRQDAITSKINFLFLSFANQQQLSYDEIAPNLEYWIEYVLREQFTTVDELVEGVSNTAWQYGSSNPNVMRFLKEFRAAPSRAEKARDFVDGLCRHALRWLAIAAAEGSNCGQNNSVASGGYEGLMYAASFVGHLIESGLLSHSLVRRHLMKPLVMHSDKDSARIKVIYELFVAAGNTLLQGLLGPNDVQLSFQMLDWPYSGVDKQKVTVRCAPVSLPCYRA